MNHTPHITKYWMQLSILGNLNLIKTLKFQNLKFRI